MEFGKIEVMGAVRETKTVELNIPRFILDFRDSFFAEDYEECQKLRDGFYEKYYNFSLELRLSFKKLSTAAGQTKKLKLQNHICGCRSEYV